MTGRLLTLDWINKFINVNHRLKHFLIYLQLGWGEKKLMLINQLSEVILDRTLLSTCRFALRKYFLPIVFGVFYDHTISRLSSARKKIVTKSFSSL